MSKRARKAKSQKDAIFTVLVLSAFSLFAVVGHIASISI
jgi:hypothetical protein